MKNFNTVIGSNLKYIREQRNLSLDKVSELTGVSKSMLGQIERGETSPSISTVWKIANGLRISFSTFLKEERLPVSIISLSEVNPITDDKEGYRVYPIFPFDANKGFEILNVEIEPGCILESEPHFKGVEEYITVFEGEMELTVENDSYTVHKLETVHFPADRTHVYKNRGKVLVRAHMLLYYPS